MSASERRDETECGCAAAGRREVLKAGMALGVGAALTPALARGQEDPARERPKPGDVLIRDTDKEGTPLTPADIKLGEKQILAWAMDPATKLIRSGTRFNRVVLMRFEPESLKPETKERAADGVVAYTAICTHAGCEVIDWLPDQNVMQCPCHFSKYDPRDGARVAAGDAPRPLPALPIKVEGGKLTVAKPFTARVGFTPV